MMVSAERMGYKIMNNKIKADNNKLMEPGLNNTDSEVEEELLEYLGSETE